ncbi:MAG: archease [Nitrospirae bacterium]|nr:archease [Nitrospirota bacterium]
MDEGRKYEQLDISGDVGLRIRGNTMEELFENAASGMFELITDTSQIKAEDKRTVVIDADNYETLLIRWLNELVFLFDAHNFVGKVFDICLSETILSAVVRGAYFDPKVNERRLLVKAATYHRLSLTKKDSEWEAEVVFDI